MFISTGQITDIGGQPIAGFEDVQCNVWPTSGARTTGTGEAYDYTGDADLEAAEELGKANRRLVVDGHSYVVVSAVGMDIIPHVELRLRRVGPAGGV